MLATDGCTHHWLIEDPDQSSERKRLRGQCRHCSAVKFFRKSGMTEEAEKRRQNIVVGTGHVDTKILGGRGYTSMLGGGRRTFHPIQGE